MKYENIENENLFKVENKAKKFVYFSLNGSDLNANTSETVDYHSVWETIHYNKNEIKYANKQRKNIIQNINIFT